MNLDLTALLNHLIWVHIVCNISYLRTEADERTDGKNSEGRHKA